MPCFKPLAAKGEKSKSGKWIIVFKEEDQRPGMTELNLPCGQCIGCRLDRSQQWATRCMHEAKQYEENCFITLTYDDYHLPPDGSLIKSHHQKFLKALRHEIHPIKIKFYMCGEYGSDEYTKRPHYHFLIFGYDFPDKKLFRTSPTELFTSATLEKLWKKGYSSVGAVTWESAAYVARYTMKKINGSMTEKIDEKTGLRPYERVNFYTGQIVEVLPEYNAMSRGGKKAGSKGIGASWFDKYHSDVYPRDSMVVNGFEHRPPRYYDNMYAQLDPDEMEIVKEKRLERMEELKHEYTPARLQARMKVTEAKINQLLRSL